MVDRSIVGSARPRVRRNAAQPPAPSMESQLLSLQQQLATLQQDTATWSSTLSQLQGRAEAAETRLYNVFTHLRDIAASVVIARSSVGTLRAQETLAELLRNLDDALRDCEDPAAQLAPEDPDDGTMIDTGSVVEFDPTQD